MPDYDLDADLRPRPKRRRNALLAVVLLSGIVVGHTGALQAAGQPGLPTTTSAADTAPLPPSGEKTSSITGLAPIKGMAPAANLSALPSSERHALIGLLMLCFIVLSLGSYALWRRHFAEFDRKR